MRSKKIGICLLLVTIVLFGCKKADKLTQFNLKYDSSITIQSTTSINIPVNLFTPDIETNSEAEFAVHDTRKDKIQKITLSGMKVTITNPPGQEFDFLKDLEVFMSADGLAEIKIASKYNISNSIGVVLTMDVTGEDFQEYIKKDNFILRVRSVTDETLLQDVDLNIESTFWVDAKLIGKA
ncbi:MAG: hypothetical protein ACI9J3_002386 [Parvicellaceae bacterium]|jgi:hypothetical protein